MASKYNVPLPGKKRRKAQKLLEDHGDFHPQAARKLSRIFRQLAEGPEAPREEMLNLFDQIVTEGRNAEVHIRILRVDGILVSFLYHLSNKSGDERIKTLHLFTKIIKEK